MHIYAERDDLSMMNDVRKVYHILSRHAFEKNSFIKTLKKRNDENRSGFFSFSFKFDFLFNGSMKFPCRFSFLIEFHSDHLFCSSFCSFLHDSCE